MTAALWFASAYGCTLATGYFHQVGQLRGVVVGVDHGDLRHLFRWSRQLITRNGAVLRLYPYSDRWPLSQPVREVKTDKHGHFDFGALPVGHYTVKIDLPESELGDRFDIEIVNQPQAFNFELVDISAIDPDCTGGHEIVASRR